MRSIFFVGLMATLLAGCQTTQNIKDSDQLVRRDLEAASATLNHVRQGTANVDNAAVVRVVEDGYFGVGAPKVLNRDRTLPMTCNIVFNPTVPLDVLGFAQVLSRNPDCKLQVRVTQDALVALKDGYNINPPQAQAAAQPATGGIPALPALPGLPAAGGSMRAASFGNASPTMIQEQFKGDVTSLLDIVTSKLGLSWRYREGVVSIFFVETRFMQAYSIPTVTGMDSTVSSGSSTSFGASSGGGGSGGGMSGGGGGVSGNSTSNQSTTVSLKTDAGGDMAKVITSMLTPNVGRMAPGMGGYVVTDRPEVLDNIAEIIGTHNEFSTLQVLLNFKVVSVTLNNDSEFGVNWKLVWESISNQFGVELASGYSSNSEAISGTVNILQGSPFAGSQLIMRALEKQGNVSVLTQPSVTTLNMEPVPVQIGNQRGFIERSETTLTNDVGSTTSLSPGTVTTGFNMNVLPYILPDKRTILMQFALNLSSLNDIRRYESGNSAIEMPDVDGRIFSQKVRIRSGETLVLSGFEQSTDSASRSGVGNSKFWLFGGGATGRKAREVLVVMITPIVQEV